VGCREVEVLDQSPFGKKKKKEKRKKRNPKETL